MGGSWNKEMPELEAAPIASIVGSFREIGGNSSVAWCRWNEVGFGMPVVGAALRAGDDSFEVIWSISLKRDCKSLWAKPFSISSNEGTWPLPTVYSFDLENPEGLSCVVISSTFFRISSALLLVNLSMRENFVGCPWTLTAKSNPLPYRSIAIYCRAVELLILPGLHFTACNPLVRKG